MSETYKWTRRRPPFDPRPTRAILVLVSVGFGLFAAFQTFEFLGAGLRLYHTYKLLDMIAGEPQVERDFRSAMNAGGEAVTNLWLEWIGTGLLLIIAAFACNRFWHARDYLICGVGALLIMASHPFGLGLGLVALYVLLMPEVRSCFHAQQTLRFSADPGPHPPKAPKGG